jgi:hypothetical protein
VDKGAFKMGLGQTIATGVIKFVSDPGDAISGIAGIVGSLKGLNAAQSSSLGLMAANFTNLIAKASVLTVAIGAITSVLKSAIMAADAEQQVSAKTAAIMAKNGESYTQYAGAIDSALKRMEAFTHFNDTDLQISMNAGAAAGLKYQDAIEFAGLAADFATTHNLSLEASSKILSGALNGNTESLKRYGMAIKDTGSSQGNLNALLEKGETKLAKAEDATNSLSSQTEGLSNQLNNLKEAFGAEFLIPIINGMSDLNAWLIRNMDTLKMVLDGLAGGVKVLYGIIKLATYVVVDFGKSLASSTYLVIALGKALTGDTEAAEKYMIKSQEMADSIVDDMKSVGATWIDAGETILGWNNTIIDSNAKVATEAELAAQREKEAAEAAAKAKEDAAAKIKDSMSIMDKYKEAQLKREGLLNDDGTVTGEVRNEDDTEGKIGLASGFDKSAAEDKARDERIAKEEENARIRQEERDKARNKTLDSIAISLKLALDAKPTQTHFNIADPGSESA